MRCRENTADSQPWGISWGGIREISVGRYLEKVRIPFEGTGNHLCVFFSRSMACSLSKLWICYGLLGGHDLWGRTHYQGETG